ncbi:MAG: NAD(P)H-flavin reductase [Gammaproteobacteria bacterium]|nr:NAD(P)H-flavin reductase [Gammaproteobacteria bacterium]
MSEIKCSVERLEPFNDSVYHVVLRPEQDFEYQAGQYLMVKMSDDDKRPFSIASAPSDGNLIELHIGASERHSYPMQVIERMQQDNEITILAPHGESYLVTDNQRPIILVAGGTGYSYIRSILRQLIATGDQRQVLIYWGCKDLSHLYLFDEAQQLADENANVTLIPVIENPASDWQGVSGLVHHAILVDHADLSGHDIYAAGRFEMVGAIRDAFLEQGMKIEHMHSDALAYLK